MRITKRKERKKKKEKKVKDDDEGLEREVFEQGQSGSSDRSTEFELGWQTATRTRRRSRRFFSGRFLSSCRKKSPIHAGKCKILTIRGTEHLSSDTDSESQDPEDFTRSPLEEFYSKIWGKLWGCGSFLFYLGNFINLCLQITLIFTWNKQ